MRALALGAKGCLIGRAYIYGLGAGGQAGVARAIEIIRKELDVTMALTGVQQHRARSTGSVAQWGEAVEACQRPPRRSRQQRRAIAF